VYKSLNYRIAKFHRYSRQFTGLYIALSNLIAIALSGVSVALGIIVYSFISIKIDTTNIVDVVKAVGLGVLFSLIGIALSFLIEGLTISNCARLRKNVENYRSLKVTHAGIEDRTEAIRLKKKQQLNNVLYTAWSSGLFVLVCSSISTLAATLFWHWILQALPTWQAALYSITFSMVVSITLVWTELARGLNDQLVNEAVGFTSLLHVAANATFEETTLEKLHSAQHDQIHDASTTDTFNDAAARMTDQLLDKTVSGGNGTLAAQLEKERKNRNAYEDAAMRHLSDGTPIPENIDQANQQPIPAATYRRDKAKNMATLRGMIADKGVDHVRQNIGDIAQQIGVDISTAYRYMAEISDKAQPA